MKVTTAQMKTVNMKKLSAYILTLNESDLYKMVNKFNDFIELLYLEGLEEEEEEAYTKALHILIDIDNALMTVTK
jgi:hypothetical protein